MGGIAPTACAISQISPWEEQLERSCTVKKSWGRRDPDDSCCFPSAARFLSTFFRGGSSTIPEQAETDEFLHVGSLVDIDSLVDGENVDAEKNAEVATTEDSSASSISGDETEEKEKVELEELVFPLITEGDGHETDPDQIPKRFLMMQKGNREHAKESLEATLKWREEVHVDTILSRPHPQLDKCKAIVPHFFSGRDKMGNVVFVQRPGRIDLDLAHRNNVTMGDLLTHYIYTIEYCWNILEPSPGGLMTNVIDLSGISLRIVNKEMIGFLKEFVHMMSANYPSRSCKTLIINAPRWFGGTYRLLKPLLRESTKAKIEICNGGKKQDDILRKHLGGANVPEELLLTPSETSTPSESEEDICGPHSLSEKGLRSFCMKYLDGNDMEMQVVI
eukprot:CAMPEP_0198293636 /NCGR_PEP_ID=MMETSP1449-20131203/18119_1 /TAXON_ID=420275 /ORGANISM="Attheya septentrionalis, Strain CCMP2084" /LENGTH=390 /DNA_ID=CAMNT_0043993289 /DNA_START=196 /DNA_END=1368 /DNA_ORIENTATION=-